MKQDKPVKVYDSKTDKQRTLINGWYNEFDKIYFCQKNSYGEAVRLITYKNEKVNIDEFLRMKMKEKHV